MRIVVTGGAGFIGSHFVDAFLEDGHDVIVIDNLSSGHKENIDPRAHFLHMDLADPGIYQLIQQLHPEAIFHFAAQIDVRMSIAEPFIDAEQNILTSLRLVDTGLASGIDYFCFASSGGAIYGEANSGPQDESHPAGPVSPYGVAKLSVDHYLRTYQSHRGLRSCSMRFSNVYGPRQNAGGEGGVVAIFADRLVNGKPLIINGDGANTRDFVFAPDLASVASKLLNDRPMGIFNFGTGIETSISKLGEMMQKIAEISSPIQHGPPILGEQKRSVLNPGKAKRELGWESAHDLSTGLEKTLQWFKTHRLPTKKAN